MQEHKCRCGTTFQSYNYIYDESGYGYSAKLVTCPRCGNKVLVEYIEDYATEMMGNLGMDYRYYEYRKE